MIMLGVVIDPDYHGGDWIASPQWIKKDYAWSIGDT